VRLDADDVEAIAARVAELLGATQAGAVRYVDAAELARALSVEREWVYAHAAQLGAIRLGGPGGRLRFDLELVRRVLTDEEPRSAPTGARVRRRRGLGGVDRRREKS
jgi:hypothetical protein